MPYLLLFFILLSTFFPFTSSLIPVNITVDASQIIQPNFNHFWRSCGYSPSEVNLRSDGIENVYTIGSTHRRGITQVRIHFLLDLLIVTGYLPDPTLPSGYRLIYDWSLLDYAIDILVKNNLSPGFELMGSPVGFPTLPLSFYTPWSNNFRVTPTQTLQMFRTMVADIIQHYGERYSVPEIQRWNFESWNEPECGWGWNYTITDPTSNVFLAYTQMWDAVAAGIEDMEKQWNISLVFGGPGSCRSPENSPILQWVFDHAANGTNVWNNLPGRLDFISIHYKGRNTSYLVAQQALDGFTYMRSPTGNHIAPSVQKIPFYNDESDPLVGWLNPEPWRADAHYGAIIPKVINQHILEIMDNATFVLNNPLGLISFDNGFINLDGYNGFAQRTMLGKFTNATSGQYALVRKQSYHIMHILSKLGTVRVNYTGSTNVATMATVAHSMIGTLATITVNDPIEPNQMSILVYNSNDTFTNDDPSSTGFISIVLASNPFTSTDRNVVLVHYRLDNTVANPYQQWLNYGSPDILSSNQTLGLWLTDKLVPYGPPVPLTIPTNPHDPLLLPSFTLPLPGVSLLHIIAQPSITSLFAPFNVEALIKDASLSLLDTTVYSEVFIHWDCDRAYNRSSSSSNNSNDSTMIQPLPSMSIWGYTIQYSLTSAQGPWITARQGSDGDYSCSFIHPLPVPSYPSLPTSTVYYQVQSIDYWERTSPWSTSIQAVPWPTIV